MEKLKKKTERENCGNVALKLLTVDAECGRNRGSSVMCFSEFPVDSVVEQ